MEIHLTIPSATSLWFHTEFCLYFFWNWFNDSNFRRMYWNLFWIFCKTFTDNFFENCFKSSSTLKTNFQIFKFDNFLGNYFGNSISNFFGKSFEKMSGIFFVLIFFCYFSFFLEYWFVNSTGSSVAYSVGNYSANIFANFLKKCFACNYFNNIFFGNFFGISSSNPFGSSFRNFFLFFSRGYIFSEPNIVDIFC